MEYVDLSLEAIAKSKEESEKGKKGSDDNITLREGMDQYTEGAVGAGIIEGLLPQNLEEMESQFANAELTDPAQAQRLYGMRIHEQNVNNLERQMSQLRGEIEKLKENCEKTQQKLDELQTENQKKMTFNQELLMRSKNLMIWSLQRTRKLFNY